jgi:16S rRNA (cytidine1402-2'-O)-methyltransferase
VTAALSASGWPLDRFAFIGFPPIRAKDRNAWFAWAQKLPDTVIVCFEAPHRIARTLEDIRVNLAERPILVVRELTKRHEEWSSSERPVVEKGEFTIIIGQKTENSADVETAPPSVEEIARIFGEITKREAPKSRREAVQAVARRTGLPVRVVYDALERAKN